MRELRIADRYRSICLSKWSKTRLDSHMTVPIEQISTFFADAAEPATFPKSVLRFRNTRWADQIGFREGSEDAWIRHFAKFESLPDNLAQPLALRYHGHQFHVYNPDLGDGRGF